MRYLALSLFLAACTSAPGASAPLDAGACVVGGSCDCGGGTVGACRLGPGGASVCVCDDVRDSGATTLDEGPSVDLPATVDVGFDLGAVDLGAVDRGAPDVGFDLGPADVPRAPCTSGTVSDCCGATCTAPPHAEAVCNAGHCGVGGCTTSYGDCDGDAANGCETDLRADVTHCGACGTACAAGLMCADGACVGCPGGRTFCGTSCILTFDDPRHCSNCDRVCFVGAHAAGALCQGTQCVLTCAAGYADCDGVDTNGCETNVQTSTSSCGACLNRCGLSQTCCHGVCHSGTC